MREKELVYVAHPYAGKAENIEKCKRKIAELVKDGRKRVYISPVLNYQGVPYEADNYKDGIDLCFELLSQCDALMLTGDWQSSKGCLAEYGFAVAAGMPIIIEITLKRRDKNE